MALIITVVEKKLAARTQLMMIVMGSRTTKTLTAKNAHQEIRSHAEPVYAHLFRRVYRVGSGGTVTVKVMMLEFVPCAMQMGILYMTDHKMATAVPQRVPQTAAEQVDVDNTFTETIRPAFRTRAPQFTHAARIRAA
jgi:hypothetical protein